MPRGAWRGLALLAAALLSPARAAEAAPGALGAPEAHGALGAPEAHGALGAPEAHGALRAPEAHGALGAPEPEGAPGAPAQEPSRWLLRFSAAEPRRVEVAAELPTSDGFVRMLAGVQAAHLARGWATYVEGLAASDARGEPLALEPLDGPRWRLTRASARTTLRYVLRLDHERARWPFGVHEAAYVHRGLVFALAQALLVYGDEQGPAELRVELPEGWRFATPWPAHARADRYDVRRVDDVRALVRGLVAAGTFAQARVSAGGLELELAVEPRLATGLDPLAGLVGALAPRYAARLGPLEPQAYLVVVGRRSGALAGGAFAGGFSLMLGALDGRERERWGPVLAHELAHEWIGLHALRFASTREEWLKEGASELVAWLELTRAGLVTRARWLAWLDEQRATYLAEAGERSLCAAGTDKQGHKGLVYGGGALACLALEDALAERGGSLTSLLGSLRASEEPLTTARFVEAVRVAAGEDAASSLVRCVEDAQALEVDALLARFGLEHAGFPFARVRVCEDAPAEARARLERLLAGD